MARCRLAPSLIWFFIGRFISAIASATLATANAWMADESEPGDRVRHFGFLSAACHSGHDGQSRACQRSG
jgi:MFS family permease